jgi:hypothetical protein
VVVEGLNRSGATGPLNIIAHVSRAIVRSLARSCGKISPSFQACYCLSPIAISSQSKFFFDPMEGVVADLVVGMHSENGQAPSNNL